MAEGGESSEGGVNEISGGTHKLTHQGGKFGQVIQKQVTQTFHAASATGKTARSVTPGSFRISSHMTVVEEEPISTRSRVFRAILHSDVTGDKNAVVKITPADKKHQREAKIHFSVPHHKNIVERIATDVFDFRGQSSVYIVMECCDCNLDDHIKSQVRNGVPFDAKKYLSISCQIVVGLSFLHSYKVVHGDLKPGNVLLILDKNVAKLCDFGLSRAVSDDKTSTVLTSPQGGTTGWQAPEGLKGTTKIGFKSDVFPLGLVTFHCFSYGKHPYGDEPVSWNHYIVKGENRNLDGMLIPDADAAKVLLESMLERNPADRPNAEDVLKHPLFAAEGKSKGREQSLSTAQLEVANAKLEQCESGLRASWDAPRNGNGVKYFVMLFCDGEEVGGNPFKTSSTSITFTGIQPSKRYHCEVMAYGFERGGRITNAMATKITKVTTQQDEPIDIEPDPENLSFPANKVTVLRGHDEGVIRCSWNPTCDLLASCSADATARIWDLTAVTGTGASPIALVLQHEVSAWRLDWNRDGTLLATGSDDGSARIWTKDGRLLHHLSQHSEGIQALKWNEQGNYLVSGSIDKTAIIWDAQSGKVKQRFRFHGAGIKDVDWMDNDCFASCSDDNNIHVCRVGCQNPVKTFKGHTGRVYAVEWDPSKRFLASCSGDATVKIWSMKQDGFVHNLRGHTDAVWSVRWSPAGPGSQNPNQKLLLASASWDGTVRLWEPERGVCLHTLKGHELMVWSVAFSPDGRLLASGSWDRCVKIWNTQSGQLVRSYEGRDLIYDVCWNAAGTKVGAACGWHGTVVLDLRK